MLDRSLGASRVYWGLGSSLGYLSRAEYWFSRAQLGAVRFYPHLALPFSAAGWTVVPEAAIRETGYIDSQTPDLTGANGGIPTFNATALARSDYEVSVDLRPPAVERDFTVSHWNRQLRHVIEPELTYRLVEGIGASARKVLLIDTTDIATNTDEVGYTLTQRFYLRPTGDQPCAAAEGAALEGCGARPGSGRVGKWRKSTISIPISAGR